MKSKTIIHILIALCLVLILAAALNIKTTTRQGIDGIVFEHRLPLYIKLSEFLDRHYHYRSLAFQITKEATTAEDKLVALFEWTHQHIKQQIPSGWPVYDDHVFNIIIRGYGSNDQSADVFTTLATYAGMPAAMYQAYSSDKRHRTIFSVVYLDGRYLLFDTYHGNYFRNQDGRIASLRDIIADPQIAAGAENKPRIHGIGYEDYFKNLVPIERFLTLRAELQMPGPRLEHMIKRKLGLCESAILFYGERP